MSETNFQKLNRMFRAASIKAPEGMEVPPYQAEDRLQRIHKVVDEIGRTVLANGAEVKVPTDEELLKLVRKKREFLERYSGMYSYVPLPLTMRLAYDTFYQRDFKAGNTVEFVFNAFQCSQELLETYEVSWEPSTIVLQVYRPPWQGVFDRNAPNPTRPPRVDGKWIPVLDFKIQQTSPFFSFEELELAHREVWEQCQEYARRSMNPCSEIPLIQQNCGWFLPKQ